MSTIRPFRPGDEAALADICLRTADAGGDASGVLDDDALWAQIFVLPYVARHPDLAFVAVDDDDRAVGYLVATDDTVAFESWFRDLWWPSRGARFVRDGANARQAGILRYADERGLAVPPWVRQHPAHLHIDLLPAAQGRGSGRRLIARLEDALRARGVPGVHLVADAANLAAGGFYDRLGFDRLPSPPGEQVFVRRF